MYFASFPIIYYEFQIGDERVLKVIRDVTVNVRIRKEILENVTLFDEYDIIEGETPEIVAAKVYGSPVYHWVIMLCNQRYDYLNDWPLTSSAFESYVNDKYPNTTGATHHYETSEGYVVHSTWPGATAVSNYDYEARVNESKRRIKLIAPSLLNEILAQFRSLV